MIRLLDAPEASYADICLSGNEGNPPIRAHRAVLGYRAKYFQKLFDFPGDKSYMCSTSAVLDAKGALRIAELTTKALKSLVGRIYGESFPGYFFEDEHVGTLLMVWHFATAGLMDGLPE